MTRRGKRGLLAGVALAAGGLFLGLSASGIGPVRLSGANTARTGPVTAAAGLYAAEGPLTTRRRELPAALYARPELGGVYVRMIWRTVEPAPGAYDWTIFDREVDRAVAAGKRVSVSVITGVHAPRWLAGAGARTAAFTIRRGSPRAPCVPVTIPVPWDARYIEMYLGLMRAMAEHLRARPGAWEAVRIVKVTPIGRFTEEMRMPTSINEGGNRVGCDAEDSDAVWAAAGYTPDRVVAGWTEVARGMARIFPGKLLAVDTLQNNDFPGPPGTDDAIRARIVRAGVAAAPGRFAVQWNGLAATPPARFLDTTVQPGVVIGFQTNALKGFGGSGCGTDRRGIMSGRGAARVCGTQEYRAILANAVGLGARYVEVWAPDVLRNPEAVARTQAELERGRAERSR